VDTQAEFPSGSLGSQRRPHGTTQETCAGDTQKLSSFHVAPSSEARYNGGEKFSLTKNSKFENIIYNETIVCAKRLRYDFEIIK